MPRCLVTNDKGANHQCDMYVFTALQSHVGLGHLYQFGLESRFL